MPRSISDETRAKRGRGIIDLQHPERYDPWIHTRECSSGHGRRHTFSDWKHPERQIHLMSDLEWEAYRMLRGNSNVVELFEQVPLNIKITRKLCRESGISHPTIPGTGKENVMTTDFLAYIQKEEETVLEAYAVKMDSDLNDQRVLEKLFIEKSYWELQGIKWAVITEKTCNFIEG